MILVDTLKKKSLVQYGYMRNKGISLYCDWGKHLRGQDIWDLKKMRELIMKYKGASADRKRLYCLYSLWLWVALKSSRGKMLNNVPQYSNGERNGNPLQYSCLENPRDRGAWWAALYGVAQSLTRLKQLSSSSSHQTEF